MMKIYLYVIIIVTFLINSTLICGKNSYIRFKKYTVENGLSDSNINAICQDQFGFIWIGTDNGLNRFDGYEFKIYSHDPNDTTTICHKEVSSVLIDKEGNLWVGSRWNGLSLYNRKTDTFKRFINNPCDSTTISYNYINYLFEDCEGNLWVGTNIGLNLFDKKTHSFIRYFGPSEFHSLIRTSTIKTIYEDKEGILWIGTFGNGLIEYNRKKNSMIHHIKQEDNPYSLSGNMITSVIEDHYGNLWIGTIDGGLNLFDKKYRRFIKYYHDAKNKYSIGNNTIFCMYVDKKNNFWIGTENGGLNRAIYELNSKNVSFEKYVNNKNIDHSINSNTIRCLLEDRQGNFWIGTYKNGINVLLVNMKKFRHYTSEPNNRNSLSYHHVTTIFENRKGQIWIGTNGGGLNLFDKKKKIFKHYKYDAYNPYSIGSNYLTKIIEDQEGNLWISTWEGLNCFDPATEMFRRFKHDDQDFNSLINNKVQYIYQDNYHNIWIATHNGLDLLDIKRNIFIHYNANPYDSNSLIDNFVFIIYQDNEGNLWIGTSRGLHYIADDNLKKGIIKFKRYMYNALNPNSISGISVSSIFGDTNGNLWIGTEEGLNLFNKKDESFITFSQKNGLPSNEILSILEDNNGYLWLGTKHGLSRFHPATYEIKNYDVNDGLQSNEFTNAHCKSSTGELYFGGINGFNVFYPDSILNNPNPPPVCITSFRIFDHYHPLGLFSNQCSSFTNNNQTIDNIELSYKNNVFSFEFAALDYTSPLKNKYAYMMEGFDEEWIYTDASRRYAVYTNLPAGRYTFRIKASNNDNIWNEKGRSIHIDIIPPLWKTTWAYIIYLALIIIILYFIWQSIIQREKLKANLQIEHLTSEKQHELDEAKLHFFTNITHEFRTPLTLIIGHIERMLHGNKRFTREKIQFYYNVVLRNAQRLLQLINQILDVRKLDSHYMKPNKRMCDIISFVRNIFNTFEYQAEQNKINYKFSASENHLEIYFDPELLEKIIYNLIANAFKFTPKKGSITINVSSNRSVSKMDSKIQAENHAILNKEEFVEISVTDTGIGIPNDQKEQIFNLFYQANHLANLKPGGSGIGLALVKELIHLHDGEIFLRSKEGKGSSFIVHLPAIKSKEMEQNYPQNESEHMFPANIEDIHSQKNKGKREYTLEEKTLDIDSLPLLLIVEDNIDLCHFLQDEFIKNFQIKTATNGNDGIKIATEFIPDLIISDIIMPEMDGFELCRILKTDQRTSHIPIILLTARTTEIDYIKGLEIGADDYITKPFSIRLLKTRIENLLELRQKLRERFSQEIYIKPNDIAITPLDKIFLQKSMDIVENNMANPNFDVKHFANEMYLSRIHLYRKLKSLTDQTPSDFIRIMRMKKAAQLLEKGQLTATEVAYRIGFKELSYFSKCFKEYFNKTPTEYNTIQKNTLKCNQI
jgi:ligand-binding sensor domain-containing protein/signal transduction histidine kinase/AraC-like DNA-binding protein